MTLEQKQAELREKMRKLRNLDNKLADRARYIFHQGQFLPNPLTAKELNDIAHMIESAALELDEPIQSNLLDNVMCIRLKAQSLSR